MRIPYKVEVAVDITVYAVDEEDALTHLIHGQRAAEESATGLDQTRRQQHEKGPQDALEQPRSEHGQPSIECACTGLRRCG